MTSLFTRMEDGDKCDFPGQVFVVLNGAIKTSFFSFCPFFFHIPKVFWFYVPRWVGVTRSDRFLLRPGRRTRFC